ncbi:hypothetical protein [Flavobacterium sp.]|uniref:hypothetical protein n=1 Tax=Flavobacterium sp. TaxID=239 RepID=UPI002625E842|nr:hypothetical protein [Flavobacterium sp.]MDD3004257.1 hypothetical protein [Flavobacterium sp.]
MALKYFNILDIRTFSDKSENEQKAILIEKNIYEIGTSIQSDISLNEYEIQRGSNNYPKYLGQDFVLNGINYKLNDDFLDEVFNECINYYKSHHTPLIENKIETLKLQAELSGDSFINEQRQREIKNYNSYLSKNLFKKLHKLDFENEQEHFDILKSYLCVNWFDLSDYLFGLNNISSYHIVSTYYSYIRTNKTLFFLNSIGTIDETGISKLTRPKFIAMLNELGFFKWQSIKDLTNEQKAKIILALLGQDYNTKGAIHNVVKNFQALNPKSELRPDKFTAQIHMEDVKKILNEITNKF